MSWPKRIMLTVVAALLVVVAVGAAWAIVSGFGTRTDAAGLPIVALADATSSTGRGTSTTTSTSSPVAQMPGAAPERMVVGQPLRMSPGMTDSGSPGYGGPSMGLPSTTLKNPPSGTTTMTTAGHGSMSTGSTGMGMETQSTTVTTVRPGSGGMMGTTPATTPATSPSPTPTTSHMGGGSGATMGGSGMGGTPTN